MTEAPLVGAGYVITVSTPTNFHEKINKSRFHLIYTGKKGIGWVFDLRNPIKIGAKMAKKLYAFPESPIRPLNVELPSNVTLCRFVDENDTNDTEWLIATMIPDLQHESPIPFWPPWRNLAQAS